MSSSLRLRTTRVDVVEKRFAPCAVLLFAALGRKEEAAEAEAIVYVYDDGAAVAVSLECDTTTTKKLCHHH